MVVPGVVAPPALPRVIGPRSADGAEHVATHDGGADIHVALCDEVVVDALFATVVAKKHLMTRASAEHPVMQSGAFPGALHDALSEGFFEALVRSGGVAVERDREVVHA
jgi:hypothetical protein